MIAGSIYSGITIGIATYLYLCVNTVPIFSALCFGMGLLTILKNEWKLFTGYACKYKCNEISEIWFFFSILLFNYMGAWFTGFLFSFDREIALKAMVICTEKINTPFYITIIKAIMCELCIWQAVENKDNVFLVLAYTAIFVICGFEHCIASAAYLGLANLSPCYIFVPIGILGNFLMGQIICLLKK